MLLPLRNRDCKERHCKITMKHLCLLVTLSSLLALIPSSLYAADAKWTRVTSAHFDAYTSESEGETKSALAHLEAARAFFLAATHSHDPGAKPVRIVVFHAEGDYTKYRPLVVGSAKAYGLPAGEGPATIVAQGLKSDMYEQLFREYTQLALDDSAPTLPYWFRAGLSMVYSTAKPGDTGMNLGAPPRSDFHNGEVGDVSLPMLFGVSREALLASRDKAAAESASGTGAARSAALGAAAGSLSSVQATLSQSQDFSRAAWMLVHMLIFQQDYRPKFGEFMRTLAGGVETGAAFGKVYSAPISKVKADLTLYAKQTGIMVMTAPFKVEKPPAPEVHPVTKEEQDQLFSTLK